MDRTQIFLLFLPSDNCERRHPKTQFFWTAYCLFSFLFFFQKNDIPLSKRISSSLRSVIGSKTDISTPTSGNLQNGNVNVGSDDDLEMVYRATKANKAVLDDGSLQDGIKNKRMEKIANAIDNTSRAFFPLAFFCFNIFYWTYY